MKNFFQKTFSSLRIRNFRLYCFGQIISLTGTFMQALAQDWLILKLTNSGLMLGLVSACQFVPMLVILPFGGVIADRFPKLKLLYITQTISGILALTLGVLVLIGAVHVWMVFVFAICLGLTNSVDNPTRQAFVFEMVGRDEIKNAQSLWTSSIGISRIIGPAIAGILIATVGMGLCFIFNAVSYIAVLIALSMIDTKQLQPSSPVPPSKGQITEGFKYMLSTPALFNSLFMMAVIGTIAYEYQISMPLFARFALHGDASVYAAIATSVGVGMLFGGILNASSKNNSKTKLFYSALVVGVLTIIASFTTSLLFAVIAFAFMGASMIIFTNTSNSMLQVNTDPKMRGRIMSFWNMAFQGSTAVGGPLIGWIGQAFGARWSLAVGGIAAILASFYGFIVLNKKSS